MCSPKRNFLHNDGVGCYYKLITNYFLSLKKNGRGVYVYVCLELKKLVI